jgi:hypothetical protein
MDQWEVFPREAVAVGRKAIEQGVARFDIPAAELHKMAEKTIREARETVQLLMKENFILDRKRPPTQEEGDPRPPLRFLGKRIDKRAGL